MNLIFSPAKFDKYYKAGELKKLIIHWFNYEYNIDLNEFHKCAFNIQGFKKETELENVKAIVLYGSILYKYFPLKKVSYYERKYILFGPKVERYAYEPKTPNDIDIMIVTDIPLTDEKIVIPKRRKRSDIVDFAHEDIPTDIETSKPVRITQTFDDGYGSWERYSGKSRIHISYRSLDQIKNGVGNGDSLSESIISYGLPLVTTKEYLHTRDSTDFPKKEKLHKIEWEITSDYEVMGYVTPIRR